MGKMGLYVFHECDHHDACIIMHVFPSHYKRQWEGQGEYIITIVAMQMAFSPKLEAIMSCRCSVAELINSQ